MEFRNLVVPPVWPHHSYPSIGHDRGGWQYLAWVVDGSVFQRERCPPIQERFKAFDWWHLGLNDKLADETSEDIDQSSVHTWTRESAMLGEILLKGMGVALIEG